MRKPPVNTCITLAAGMAIGLSLLRIFWPQSTHQGKTISQWFDEFCYPALTVADGPIAAKTGSSGKRLFYNARTGKWIPVVRDLDTGRVLIDPETGREMEFPPMTALRAFGNESVDFLARRLLQRESWSERSYRRIKLQVDPLLNSVLGIGMPSLRDSHPGAWEQLAIASALMGMGTNARPAVPILIASLDDLDTTRYLSGDPRLKLLRAWACQKQDILPTLRQMSARKQYKQVTLVISGLDLRGEDVAELLGLAMTETDLFHRQNTLRHLEALGPDARKALVPVMNALADPQYERASLHPQYQALATPAAGWLSLNESVRYLAIRTLGKIGQEASNAAPLLQAAVRDPNDQMRQAASAALLIIAPERNGGKECNPMDHKSQP